MRGLSLGGNRVPAMKFAAAGLVIVACPIRYFSRLAITPSTRDLDTTTIIFVGEFVGKEIIILPNILFYIGYFDLTGGGSVRNTIIHYGSY